MTRWDASKPPTPYNLVLMMQNEADKLAERGASAFPPELVEKINKRLAWAEKACEDSWGNSSMGANVYKTRSFPACPQNTTNLTTSISFGLLGFGIGGLVFQHLNK